MGKKKEDDINTKCMELISNRAQEDIDYLQSKTFDNYLKHHHDRRNTLQTNDCDNQSTSFEHKNLVCSILPHNMQLLSMPKCNFYKSALYDVLGILFFNQKENNSNGDFFSFTDMGDTISLIMDMNHQLPDDTTFSVAKDYRGIIVHFGGSSANAIGSIQEVVEPLAKLDVDIILMSIFHGCVLLASQDMFEIVVNALKVKSYSFEDISGINNQIDHFFVSDSGENKSIKQAEDTMLHLSLENEHPSVELTSVSGKALISFIPACNILDCMYSLLKIFFYTPNEGIYSGIRVFSTLNRSATVIMNSDLTKFLPSQYICSNEQEWKGFELLSGEIPTSSSNAINEVASILAKNKIPIMYLGTMSSDVVYVPIHQMSSTVKSLTETIPISICFDNS